MYVYIFHVKIFYPKVYWNYLKNEEKKIENAFFPSKLFCVGFVTSLVLIELSEAFDVYMGSWWVDGNFKWNAWKWRSKLIINSRFECLEVK